jgi:hypothetical protein
MAAIVIASPGREIPGHNSPSHDSEGRPSKYGVEPQIELRSFNGLIARMCLITGFYVAEFQVQCHPLDSG